MHRHNKYRVPFPRVEQNDLSFNSLIKAVEECDEYEVELMLQHKINVNTTDLDKVPLNIASAKGYVRIAEKLIDAGARLDSEDFDKNTPVLNAAREGHVALMDLLIKKGANIKTINTEDRDTIASIAAKENRIPILDYLWENHKDDMLEMRQNIWHKVAQEGQIEVMEWLYQKSFDINAKSSIGWTPLHFAYDAKQNEAIQWLLSHGADPNVIDNKGNKPAEYNGVDMSLIDIDTHADVIVIKPRAKSYRTRINQVNKIKDVNTSDLEKLNELLNAIEENSLEKVQNILIENDSVVNTSHLEKVPLIIASYQGNRDIVIKLLDASANVGAVDQDGDTALHVAAEKGHLEVVKLLLERGADIAVVSNSRGTPFHYALSNGQIEIAEYFWANYADKIQKLRPTFFHWAISGQQFESMGWLVDNLKFLDINQKNSQGETPLHFAVLGFKGEEKICKAINYLLEKGANSYMVNNEGKTPLNLYVELGYSSQKICDALSTGKPQYIEDKSAEEKYKINTAGDKPYILENMEIELALCCKDVDATDMDTSDGEDDFVVVMGEVIDQ